MADEERDLSAESTRLGPKPVPAQPTVGYPGDDGRDLTQESTTLSRPSVLKTSFRDNRTGSLWDETTHNLGVGTRNVIEGITSLPTTLADVVTWPGRAIQRAAGVPTVAPSDMASKLFDVTGLPTAQTPEEQRNAEIIRGGAAMLTPMGLGAVAPGLTATLPAAVRPLIATNPGTPIQTAGQVVAGATGAAAGDAAAKSELVPDWLKPTARIGGNVVGAGLTTGLQHAAGTLVNAVKGVPTEIAAALERLGITPGTMAAVSTRPGVATTEGMLSKAPLAGDILKRGQRETIDQFGNAVENRASGLSLQADTPKAAGQVVQTELRNWRENVFPAEQAAVWDPLAQRMAGTAVDPAPYRAALERMANPPDLGSMPNTQAAFASAQAKKWLEALNADAPPGKSLSWEQAHAVRKRIGDAMGTPDIVAGMGAKGLQSIYGSLAEGMEATAAQHGQKALFDAANRVTTEGHQFINGTLSKGISKPNQLQETISPDDAAKSMLGDNQALEQLRQRVPKAADAIAAWNLRQSAQATGSKQGADSTISPETFLTKLRNEQLRRPEGMGALYGGQAASLYDLMKVAEQLRAVQHNVNVSGSAGVGQLLSLPFQIAGAYQVGGLPGVGATLAANLAPAGAAKVLTNPMAIRLAGTKPGPRQPLTGTQAGILGAAATGRDDDIQTIHVRP